MTARHSLTAGRGRGRASDCVRAADSARGADQGQHKAAVDACVTLADTAEKSKGAKVRVQRVAMEPAMETTREAGALYARCEGDVATFVSPVSSVCL